MHLSASEAEQALTDLARETGYAVTDPVRFGTGLFLEGLGIR